MRSSTTLLEKPSELLDRLSFVVRPSIVIGIIYILLLNIITLTHGYQMLDYVHIGTVWSEHNPNGTWGYDGQFYYQLARDPFKAFEFMDNAPYRYQRILFPLIAHLLSLGQLAIIPHAMIFINLLSIIFSVEIVSYLLNRYELSPWYSLALGLYYGQAVSLTFDTAEPLSCLLLCLGVLMLEEESIVWAAACMGLAALTRETAVLFPLGYLLYFLLQRAWKKSLLFCLFGIIPILIWLLALGLIFGKTGLTFSPPFEKTPFGGIFFYSHTPRKFWLLLLIVFIPLLISWFQISIGAFYQRWGPHIIICSINLIMITQMSRLSYMELVSCGRITSVLVLATLLYALHTRNRFFLWITQCYGLTFVIFLAGIFIHLDSLII